MIKFNHKNEFLDGLRGTKTRWGKRVLLLESAMIAYGDSIQLCHYACYVIKGPWPEVEKIIAQDAMASVHYACNVLKKRFLLGEPNIAKNHFWLNTYKSFLTTEDRKEFNKSP